MPPTAIHLRSVGLSRGGRQVLQGVDLTIERTGKVAILGPSGVGKSSLLQAVAGLASVSTGTIAIDGRAVNGPVPSVTMMLQRPALLPWATAGENVALGLHFSGLFRRAPRQAEHRVRELLDRVGLADRDGAKPSELSGGEQQRVALARALAPNPKILLLDEPFSALDPVTRAGLRNDINRLTSDNGVTVLLVTHDVADATAVCRRIVRLAGRPARISSDDLIASPSISPETSIADAA